MAVKLKGFKKKPPNSDINVTPLIDVVLVLLIIFMVITPILIYEMAVNLPDKTETVQQEDMPKDQLVAAVCRDGTYALNRKPMKLSELHEQVRKRLRVRKEKVIFVDAHPDAPYDRVIELMDMVRDAGAERIGVASLKSAEDFRACTPPDSAPAAAAADAPAAG